MSYKLFISFTGEDKIIAETIRNDLLTFFKNNVEVFISSKNIKVGSTWVELIKDKLINSDGIFSLFTPRSIFKPWMYVEWTAFWLNEKSKDIYICLTDKNLSKELIPPIEKTQYMVLSDRDNVIDLFTILAEKSGTYPPPFGQVDSFLSNIDKAIKLRQKQEYHEIAEHLERLPKEDEEKIKIAEYFIMNDENTNFEKIIPKVRSDYLKTLLATKLIDLGEPKKVSYFFNEIRASQNQAEVIFTLIDNAYEDINLYKNFIESIYHKNQTDLSNISRYLIDLNKEDTELFKLVTSTIDNMAELRKVAYKFIDLKKHNNNIFNDIIERFRNKNRVELKKIGQYMIGKGDDLKPELDKILQILHDTNKEQLEMILNDIKNIYPDLFKKYNVAVDVSNT